MKYLKVLGILTVFGMLFLIPAPAAHAQVAVGIGVGPAYVGPAPVCAYGYYPYYPYACAPYGYYGPDWFVGGVFIGAGPWFHGFYGHPGYWGRPGFYGRPGFAGPHGFAGRGPAVAPRGPVGGFHSFGGSVHGGSSGGFHGGGFHGGGGSHGGGRR
jgi:uncharacterized membrane protein YgcG